MRRLPKVGERVRVKPINCKGRVMAVHMKELTSRYHDIWPAIQIRLDKPYDSSPTWRAHKEELVFIKESAQAKRMAELKAKIQEMRRKKKWEKADVGETQYQGQRRKYRRNSR